MEKKEILKKVKEIELRSTLLAKEVFSGSYYSCFHGNGMEFTEVRRYAPGDEIKNIDWKVTARQRKAYVKKYVEERELGVYILVDVSSSNQYEQQKQTIAELLTTIAFSANSNDDKVGGLFFTDKIERLLPLKKGKKHSLSILDFYLSLQSRAEKTNISYAIDYLKRIVEKNSIVFIISDFLDDNYEESIKLLSRKHDVILIRVLERGINTLPKGAIFNFFDSETGEEINYENLKENIELIENFSFKNSFTIYSDEDYRKKLLRFFKERRKKWNK